MPVFDEALTLELYVEGRPVSVNAMYGSRLVGSVNGPTKFLSVEAKAWRETVRAETWTERLTQGENPAKTADYRLPLKVACLFYGCRADADNLLKLTLDGLKEGLRIDDRHFAVVESGKAPTFIRNGRRFRGCWIGVWESVVEAPGAAAGEAPGGAA